MAEDQEPLDGLTPDRVFDGGDLDCGSGLVLLLRQAMSEVPPAGVLELRSREPSVAADLPPWCRMVGHRYLGTLTGPSGVRHFLRKGDGPEEDDALAEDKQRARDYEWRLRCRATAPLQSTVYCRNFSFAVGQPASFEERDAHPSALELMLGALGGSLCTAYATECARRGLGVEDIELTVRGALENVLAHLGLEPGDPGLSRLAIKCFVSSGEAEEALREAWEATLARAPLLVTLRRAVPADIQLAVV